MKAVIQRVKQAAVTVDNTVIGAIDKGFMILLGVHEDDTMAEVDWLAEKIIKMRIFSDENDKMNLSISDVQGAILLVSQFTLHAATHKGNRPSYITAAKPDVAIPLYEAMISKLTALLGKPIATGQFGAMMDVSLINDGPVTIIIDTKNP